jgi:TonB family protein
MGYRALLFCPDDKLARVVSQVFTELDFSIEHVQEPFGAVKRLMAQRYDAVVVDCENEPNATLLFKSARNSSANQSSLAIAVVEGQAGIAKAYRIGANLVLTKPINVEQAKGTLRVARGLLRKTADAVAVTNVNPPAASRAPLAATAPPASVSVEAVSRSVEPVAAPANKSALPEFETALPAMAAPANVEESPAAAPAREVQAKPLAMAQPPAEGRARTTPEQAKIQAAPAASKAMESAANFPTGQGAAAAPAPAREASPAKKTVEFEAAYQKDDSSSTFGSASVVDGPSFGALDEENAGGSGGSKRILVAAAVVLALATLGYVGWTKLSTPKMGVTSPAERQPQPPPQPVTPPTAAPLAVPVSTPATGSTNRADDNTPGTSKIAVASTTKPAAAGSSPVLRIDVNSEPATKNLDVTRIVVKSTPAKQPSARTEEAAAQLPSPLSVGASSESGLSSLTAPSIRSQPSLVKVNISQGVSQGLLIKRVQPKYPQNGLAMHLQGAVQLSAMIDKEGKIVNLKVLKGDAVLARSAMDAVRQWRYKPYYLDGVPVDIETQITVNFRLPN